MLEYLKEKEMLPDVCVVAEPTCEEIFGDAIKVGRRGSINGYLTLKGKQGHAAYPEKAINPIHLIANNELKMMFNVRNNTKTTQKEIRIFIAKHLEDLDYELRLTQGSYPFKTDTDTKLVKMIDSAIERVTGISTKHSTAGGTSDARFVAAFGIDVIEFVIGSNADGNSVAVA